MTTRQVAIRVKSEGKAEVLRDLKDIGAEGGKSYERIAAGAEKATTAGDKAAAGLDRQMEKWRKLAAAAKEAQAIEERQARFNAMLGVGGGSGKSARDSASVFEAAPRRGLSPALRQTAIYTASDFVASAASGASPGVIALQQGPQVLQAIALEGGKANASLLKLLGTVGLVGGVVAAGTVIWLSHVDAIGRLDTAARGLGSTAGLTASQIEMMARLGAQAGEISRASAREMAVAYLETGRIGGDVLARLIGVTERYAKTTAQDAKSATAELAKAMAEPAKGIDVLQGKLHFLDDATYRYIQTLISQNRTADAQNAILDAMGPKLLRAADNVNVLSAAWANLSRNFSNGVAAVGAGIDRLLGGGPLEQQIADLIKKREALEPWLKVNNASARAQATALDAQIKKLTADWQARIMDADAKRTNGVVSDARDAIGRANPLPGRIRDLEAERAKIQAGIDSGAMTPETLKEARAALVSVNKEIDAMRAGYKSSAAEASALAKANRANAKDAREAAREAEEARRNAARLADIELRGRLDLARAAGDRSAVEELERETRIRQIAQDLASAGVATAKARAQAEAQVGAELKAQYEEMRRNVIGSTRAPQDPTFVSTEKALGNLKVVYDENAAGLRVLRGATEDAFDILADKLALGSRAWGSWRDAARDAIGEITSDLTRLILLNPIKNAIFGGVQGYNPLPTLGGNFFTSLFKKIPGFADGTSSAPGGWAMVGERGPELVNLPRGSQVFTNEQTRRMGGQTINVSINAESGVGAERIKAWVMEGMRRAVREAGENVPSIVNEGLQRRVIG